MSRITPSLKIWSVGGRDYKELVQVALSNDIGHKDTLLVIPPFHHKSSLEPGVMHKGKRYDPWPDLSRL